MNVTLTASATRTCLCCDIQIGTNPDTIFRPGHDARMASRVARQAARAVMNGEAVLSDQALYASLPTAALRRKALSIAGTIIDRTEAKLARKAAKDARKAANKASKTHKSEAKAPKTGTVKIGRWTYPARDAGNGAERNIKRDGSGTWEGVDYAKVIWA